MFYFSVNRIDASRYQIASVWKGIKDPFTQTPQCVNAINGKIRTIHILMILSHCTRDAALRVQYERIIYGSNFSVNRIDASRYRASSVWKDLKVDSI